MIDYEAYEAYESRFESRADRRTKARVSKPKHPPENASIELSDPSDTADFGFHPSYKASHHDHGEMQWIIGALSGFYDDRLINDVLRAVKGGKEASVYCCAAHPATGVELIAGKIYRPRMFRSLKNDALYRENREIVGREGKTITARDHRARRAIAQMTRFGASLRIGSWIASEYETLTMLHSAGCDIPRPFALGENAILMEYLGDEDAPAPTLNDVALDRSEAQPLFDRVMRNVELMLFNHRVHADLSAYNILYWDGAISLIDFPQAVDPRLNRHAETLLARDVKRVCQYFNRYGVRADPFALTRDLWSRYMRGAEAA